MRIPFASLAHRGVPNSVRAGRLLGLSLALIVLGCDAPPPEDLGPRNGTLAPCPSTPNCVHTGLRHPDGTRGIYLVGGPSLSELMDRLRAAVESMPRTTIVDESERYIHAEARSLVFRFVDDLELLVAPDRELVVRSASRVGRRDFGVNAERVERLRTLLEEEGLVR